MSPKPLVSSATRFPAKLSNTTFVPSGEKRAVVLELNPATPDASAETRVTAPVTRSLTTMSYAFVSSATRLSARVSNATFVPSEEKVAFWLVLLACTPSALVETSVTAPVTRSLMKMSVLMVPSFATRLSALLSNSSFVPSGEKLGPRLAALPCAPDASVETRVMAIAGSVPAMTGASLTAVKAIVVVGALLAWLAASPSSTTQLMVRVALVPKTSGLSLVEEKVTERSAAWYWAIVAVPVSVSTWVAAL